MAGWLYRTALHLALDQLKKRRRRDRYESLAPPPNPLHTPEERFALEETRERVRRTLAALKPAQASLLILRGEGYTLAEIAALLDLHAPSVGTFLARADQAFRKEYVSRYGSLNTAELRQWVAERIAALDPPADYRPDADPALVQMHDRIRTHLWTPAWWRRAGIAAAVLAGVVLLFSTGRVAAQLWQMLLVHRVAVIKVNPWRREFLRRRSMCSARSSRPFRRAMSRMPPGACITSRACRMPGCSAASRLS